MKAYNTETALISIIVAQIILVASYIRMQISTPVPRAPITNIERFVEFMPSEFLDKHKRINKLEEEIEGLQFELTEQAEQQKINVHKQEQLLEYIRNRKK